ncbi:FAD-dependent oxidoreductase [Janibacter corallicola]|uniref:FAD-dependent oxidoreductase n=1 Tax=Janibacter corallicola TaxID=415212 RepID=UPI000829EE4B|nr:NAD(P)/FAD-dependent oxidoreductase [Janibacter corallicola]
MRERVLVVGGGIAGLALAAALDPRRVEVTLVEERPERAGAGTVLTLWRPALAAVGRIGLGEQLAAAGRASDHGTLRDSRGEVLTSRRVPRLTFVPRPALVAALEGALPEGVTRMTTGVTDPRALAAELGADLVVGADGVRSTCRRDAFPGTDPVATDQVVLRGHLAQEATDPTEWWGPGGVFGATPGPRGSAWFCSVHDPGPRTPTVDHADVLALATRHFADWDPRLGEVLRIAGEGADAQRILLTPAMRRITADGLVLIGDAAHGMAPNLGRGANEAIHDALVLAGAVHRHGAKGAPAPFARRRHLRTQALRATATVAMRTATSRRLPPVRDPLLRLLPGDVDHHAIRGGSG